MGKTIESPILTTAPLTNVGPCHKALMHAIERRHHLPGLVCFYGPSGFGKSTAAAYAANKSRAYYVSCKSTWTRKAVLMEIAREMGLNHGSTLYELGNQISERLAISGRPLIIDEFDFLVDRKAVEIVRDLYEGSGAAVMIIGEEQLPHKLRRWERFHGRVLDWLPAQPATREDATLIARLYAREVDIADDLLDKVHALARGSVRRIATNVEMIRQEAPLHGWKRVDLATWGDRPLYTGEPPARR